LQSDIFAPACLSQNVSCRIAMNTWEMDSITSVPKLLAAISEFLPAARTVSFEIQNACSDARKVYAKHHSLEKLRPSRDTIAPRTQLHYCLISRSLSEDLDAVLRSHEIKEVFWHLKGFDDRKMLFAIHDADMGDSVFFSGHIDGKVIHSIGLAIGRESTKLQTGYNWDKNYRREESS
jgi:hypothetical protein